MTIVMEELEKHERKFAEYERSRDETSKLALRRWEFILLLVQAFPIKWDHRPVLSFKA